MRHALVAVVALLATACGGGSGTTTEEEPEPEAPSASEPVLPTAPPVDEAELQRQEELVQLAAAAQEQAALLNAQEDDVPPREGPVIGADISWPQCPPGLGIEHKETSGQPMPTDEAEYVVVGLTNGPGFHANPCLADQVAWVKERGLLIAAYSVISWPDEAAQTEHGGLRGAGYAQAQFNIASMKESGLESPLVWLDVEQVPFYEWSADTAANAEVVVGAAQGYLDAGYRVGVYSTPYIWESLVGDLSLRLPEWRAAGQTSQAEALDRCGRDWSIQGGEAVLGQWVQDGRDKNVTCPGIAEHLARWFARA